MKQNPDDLIGTVNLPSNYNAVRMLSRMARAYHALVPYPSYSKLTRDWKVEERGPFPRCRPFVQTLVNKGATWLFGKQVTFRIAEDDELGDSKYDALNELINQVWTDNDMTRRSRMSAIIGANSGGVVAKYSYDEATGVQIDLLDPGEQVRLYWNPENIQELWMARIQYPLYNAKDGKVYWHREDYTDTTFVVYKSILMADVTNAQYKDPYEHAESVDMWTKWEEVSREPNKFGVIPLWYIRNRENGTEYGEGDLWSMYECIDQINFTYNLGHIDNQKSIDPTKALIDLGAGDGDQPGAVQDSKTLILQSTNSDDGKQGKVEVIQTNAALRPHLDDFAKMLKHELLMAVGSVDFEPSEVTNKGNLTAAVMLQMYAPLVERTGEKRQCYGEDGYCVFLERMSAGLHYLSVPGWLPDLDIQIVWHPYFEETEDEKTLLADRQIKLLESNLTTHDRAVREVANSDGVLDIDTLIKETEAQKAEAEAKELKDQQMQMTQMERQRKGLGG